MFLCSWVHLHVYFYSNLMNFYVLNFVFMFFNFVKINFLNLYADVSLVMWHFYNILISPAANSAISVG